MSMINVNNLRPIVGDGKKLFVETYGCQMNVGDTEIVVSIMQKEGYIYTDNINEADVILINTCSIRDNAEQRIWGRLTEMRRLRKKKPSLLIGIITPIDGNVTFTALAIVSTIVVVKLIDDFIIQPTLYSDRVQAHPLEVFLVILIAGYVGGIWGMLLAIPLYTVLRVFAREFFSEYGLVRRLTGQMTK